MTDLSRRSFLRGLLTVAAVSIAPALPAAFDLPRVVGDGIHDDTLGLQAALDGKPFVCDGQMVTGTKNIRLGAGTFRISSTLYFRQGVSVEGSGRSTVFDAAPGFVGDCMIWCDHTVSLAEFSVHGAENTAVAFGASA